MGIVFVSFHAISNIVTSTRASLVSKPKHPALPATAPPVVPGNPIHLVNKESSFFFDTCTDRGDISSHPLTRTVFSDHSMPLIMLRTTMPSNISNANTVLVQLPMNTIARFCVWENFHISCNLLTSFLSFSSKKYLAIAGVRNDEYLIRSLSVSRK